MRGLAAFVIAAMFATAVFGEEEAELVGDWMIIKEFDVFTNKNTVSAISIVDETLFGFRCWNDFFTLYIANAQGGFKNTGETANVGIRLGNSEPRFSDWNTMENGLRLASQIPTNLAAGIFVSNASEIVFHFFRDGDYETPVFSLDGYDVAYLEVIDACEDE